MELKNIMAALLVALSLAVPTETQAAGGGGGAGAAAEVGHESVDREAVIAALTADLRGSAKALVIDALATIGAVNWTAFREQVGQLITPDMDGLYRSRVIKALTKIPAAHWADFQAQVKHFITTDMNGSNRAYVIGVLAAALARIESANWMAFGEQLRQLITPGMDASSRVRVIEALANALAKIGAASWTAFREQVGQLITPDMDGGDRSLIIDALAIIGAASWMAFREQVGQFITPDMSGWARSLIIYALAIIGAASWTAFGEQVRQLITPGMDAWSRVRVIEALAAALAKIGAANWTAFREQVQQLITPDMDGSNRALVIFSLVRIESANWTDFREQVGQLITPDMDGWARARVIEALAKIELANWTAFREQAGQLITPDMSGYSGYNRFQVIEALAEIESANWTTFVEQVGQLITHDMDGRDRVRVIGALARAPEAERAGRIERARNLENYNPVAGDDMHRLILVLETPLNQPVPPRGGVGMAALAAAGHVAVGVHAESRDGKTKAAFKRLIEVQGAKTPEQLATAYQVFIDYLRACPDKARVRLAQRALGLDADCNPLAGAAAGGSIFEPFLLNRFIKEFIGVDSREVLARLVIFAQDFVDPHGEPVATRLSALMDNAINALDGQGPDAGPVCHYGQLQHMAVGLLQGRLILADGTQVNIDGEHWVAPVVLRDALRAPPSLRHLNQASAGRQDERGTGAGAAAPIKRTAAQWAGRFFAREEHQELRGAQLAQAVRVFCEEIKAGEGVAFTPEDEENFIKEIRSFRENSGEDELAKELKAFDAVINGEAGAAMPAAAGGKHPRDEGAGGSAGKRPRR